MPSPIAFLDGSVNLDLEPSRILAVWEGPEGGSGAPIAEEIRRQIEHPLEFPPLRQAVVPGDRVVIAVDSTVPETASLLPPIVEILRESGIEPDHIAILTNAPGFKTSVDVDSSIQIHDRGDRESLAYLATTENEHRIYLHRALVEADFVMSVGTTAPDPAVGTWGPWATIYPGLADEEAGRWFQTTSTDDGQARMAEIAEVAWLLGNQFQIAVIPGTRGVREIVAGESRKVLEAATRRLHANWTFQVDHRAEVVVVGLESDATIDNLWLAFEKATALVRRGGKIIAISSVRGKPGPAASRLAGDDQPGISSLRGAEDQPDFASASALARSMGWADLYLLSGMDADVVESLGIMPLADPSEARRLANLASEIIVLHHPQWTRVLVTEDDE